MMQRISVEDFVTDAQKLAIRAPIDQATSLPRQAFLDEEFLQLEVEHLFGRHWTALCFAEQVKEPGALLVMEFAGMPLLVMHGSDGIVRIFHNIVPYDGCLAVIEQPDAPLEAIITPYHGWTYDLQGKLTAMPFWDGNKQADLGSLGERSGDLREIASHTELGVVFMDMYGQAGSFDGYMQPLRKALANYRTEDLTIGLNEQNKPYIDNEELATNWKTHYENWAINVLHEGFTHDIYAKSDQIPRVDANRQKTYVEHIDGLLMALSYQEDDFEETYELDGPYNHLGKDPDTPPQDAYIGSFFPNLHFAVFSYFIHMVISIPISAGRTKTIRTQMYDQESAADPEYLEERLEVMEEFRLAGQEDGRITEAVQKARCSPAFQQQFYSPFWDNMHYNFSKLVLNALEQEK